MLVVVAFVVLAYNVVVYPVGAKKDVKYAAVELIVLANKLFNTFKLVIEEVAASIWLAAKLFPVKFVRVVDASVEEPVAKIFPAVNIPDTLDVVAKDVDEYEF